MNFVDEDNGATTMLAEPIACRSECLTEIFHTRRHGREANKLRLGGCRHDFREGGLAGARWPPEHDGCQAVGFHQCTQRSVGPDEMPLTNDLVDVTWPQPRCERRLPTQLLVHRGGEEVFGRDALLGRGWQDANAEFGQLRGVDLRRSVRHRIEP